MLPVNRLYLSNSSMEEGLAVYTKRKRERRGVEFTVAVWTLVGGRGGQKVWRL